jgi:adenylate kinase
MTTTPRGACVLVFGVSGVGKSTACATFSLRHPEWLHVKASGLLTCATGVDGEALRTSPADAILGNQELLGDALMRARSLNWSAPVLLEAHGVIDNGQHLVPVPTDVVRSLQPDGLILLEIEAQKLIERRALDGRNRPARTRKALEKELRLERTIVGDYARKLGVPLLSGRTEQECALDPLIEKLLGSIDPAKGGPR